MNDLLPCPFCGADARRHARGVAICVECGVEAHWMLWNCRATRPMKLGGLIPGLLSYEQIRDLPEDGRCGVYFLFYGTRIAYIGQSKNIGARIAWHKRGRPVSDVRVLECSEPELAKVESLHINFYMPTENLMVPALYA